MSQWLYAAMAKAGLAVELLETRHVRTAFKTMPVKTDKKDARGIAQLMRLGWFRPVHCKSAPAQEVRAVLAARKLLQGKLHDVEMSLRGILRGFGLKVGATTPKTYAPRVKTLVEGHATLEAIAAALLKAREALADELRGIERRVRAMAREDERARRLMSTPGVGVLVALTFVAAVDDPERFRSSRAVGPHFGLTPRKYQSGETDYTGRISKIGDAGVRAMLYEAANVILTRPVRGSDLKTWALAVARRAGHAQGEGRPRPQARRRAAQDAARPDHLRRPQERADGRLTPEEDAPTSGGPHHHPSGAKSLRRDDGSRQAVTSAAAPSGDCANERSVDGSSANTIEQRHRSTADRSKPPAKETTLKGLTRRGPLQKRTFQPPGP